MSNKKKLQEHLKKYGKDRSWVDLYNMFPIRGGNLTNKQKSDTIRQFVKNLPTPEEVVEDYQPTKEDLFQEFLEWKKGKLISHTKPKVKNQNKFTTPGFHVIIGCVHVPFHNHKLLGAFCQFLEDNRYNIKGFHIAGDFLDLNTLSSYDKGNFPVIKDLTLYKEYEAGNQVLDIFDVILQPNIDKSYVAGNHEYRHNKYARNMEKSKTMVQSPKEALKLYERGYNVHEAWDQDFITLGNDLDIMHGVYYNVNCAKKHLDTFRRSLVFFHTHRIQSYIEGKIGAYNGGCMVDIDSKAFNYASRATKKHWQNGFNVVYIDTDGSYYMNQIICNENKFIYNGKLYK